MLKNIFMKVSKFLLATHKETPADAEIVSHQLMLRAGMIRKLGSGLYTWLPLGLRVLNKIQSIVRSEMDASGALELLMPSIQPAELWQETSRWDTFGPLLLKMKDRGQREFCYGPTHEEVITDLMRTELKSYKQLPINFYQIQTKFRDEIRPRFGVMRAREFTMKDAYSFHLDEQCLNQTYQVMYNTYTKIFTRMGLNFRAVMADTGSIGGNTSHEFQVLAESGEDVIFYSDESDYAANIEKATALLPEPNENESMANLEQISTPGQKTIEDISTFLNTKPQQTVKTLIVHGHESPLVALILRGDHQLNELKAEKHPLIKSPLVFANDDEIAEQLHCPTGFVGPIGLDNIPIIADHSALVLKNFVCGANAVDAHFINANWGRDIDKSTVHAFDLRNVVEGDLSPDGKGKLKQCRGIEVGHIFQLGNKYSQSMGATVLNQKGQASEMVMGCYGLGVSRIVAAAIEQNHDQRGIIWPQSIAPFDIALVPINMHKSEQLREVTQALYQQLTQAGYDVLLDDRNERAGVIFADMDLIGLPHRLVLSDKHLSTGLVEYKNRKHQETQMIALDTVLEFLKQNAQAD